MNTLPSAIVPAQRVLMGPGPSDVPARVLQALGAPTIGHLDPQYLRVMDETRKMLQAVFKTENPLTVVMPGTGSAGMEACFANLVEAGDEVIVAINGVFGARMQDVAQRYGATVHTIEEKWGNAISLRAAQDALKAHPKSKLFCIVHAETSTGVLQDLTDISKAVHEAGALLLVDAVTSLGGVELKVDEWQIDACYSGTQKNLSCPPGLAPVTFSAAAVAAMDARKTKVANWYLDLSLIRNYWGENRVYHHTAPINMTYALHEALRAVLEEGLQARIQRHQREHRALRAGLESLGLRYVPRDTLPNLNCVHIPDGVNDAEVRTALLQEFGIEIGAGLGPFKGKAWRIGLMGASCTRRNVVLVLSALETLLLRQGIEVAPGAALAAASAAQ